MFGLGVPELIVICVIALLVFGPKRLPEAGKAIGQAIRGFKASVDRHDEDQPLDRAMHTRTCTACGKPLEMSAAYCGACGHALKQTTM